MRKLLLHIAALLLAVNASAASRLDSLAQRLRLFGERIPQEKVYVHMDNTGYFLGDTIWFAAYTIQTNTTGSSNISKVLYAELWNHDGYLVERKLVEMTNGRGKGFFALTDSLMYGGFYELRAYTRWQLNWGEYQHRHKKNARWWFFNNTMAREYFRDYDKLYSRVFPVYDKPQAPGDYFHDMTQRPLHRQYSSEEKKKLELSLYPEGGQLIEGVPCQVAFEAAMTDGEYRSGKLEVTTGDSVVAKAETWNRGRGVFEITPVSGKTYKVLFIADKDEEEEKAPSCSERLPKADTDGVNVHLYQEANQWQADIRVCGVTEQQTLGVTVMHQGVLEYFQPLESPETQLQLPDSILAAGVNQLTVFDDEGRVYADRLFFVKKPELRKPTLAINGIKDQYEPFEEVRLEIQSESIGARDSVATPAVISMAVRDAVHTDITFDTGNIMTEMLLASEIKGFVPQPEWFFESDDEEHRRGLDLLMMTQGWRRFNWQEMAVSGHFEIVHPAEYTPILTGAVHKYRGHLKENPPLEQVYYNHYIMMGIDPIDASEYIAELFGKKSLTHGRHQFQGKDYHHIDRMDSIQSLTKEMKEKMALDGEKLRREVRVHAEFVDYDNKESVEGDVETVRGRFTIHVPKFYGHCLLFLGASDTTKWGRRFLFWKRKPHQWIMPDEEEYPEYYVRLSYPYPRFVKPYTFYHINYAETKDGSSGNYSFGGRMLKTVNVRRRRGRRVSYRFIKPIIVMDAYDAFNTVVDAGFIEGWYTGADNLGSSFGRYLVSDMGGGLDYETMAGEKKHKRDNEPRKNDWQFYGHLENIDRIEVFCDYSPRLEGDKRFMEAERPPVDVIAMQYPRGQQRVTYRDRFIHLPGYAYIEDFYHPDYHRNPPKEGQKDYRRTLYWNPDLQLDNDGHAVINFFNNSQKTSIVVEAEGMTKDGGLLYNN